MTGSESEFYEITSSEAESICTSDEEDAERLEVVLEGAYTCSPNLYQYSSLDPAERSSLLFFDKDIGESGDECKCGNTVLKGFDCFCICR